MNKPKVIITRKWPGEVEQTLQALFDVQLNADDHKMTVEELGTAIQSADAVCPTVSDHTITAEVLGDATRRCKLLANFGVGFNNIDTKAAKQANIAVSNTPEVLTDCTADIAMTLLLMIARRAAEGERLIRDKQWDGWRPTHMLGTKVTGKQLGFIGFGRIARAVAHKAHFGFDMAISFYDPFSPPAEVVAQFSAKQYGSIEEIMETADFVTVHCTGGGGNTNLINAQRLNLMKNTAFLINTARGDVVNEADLVQALQDRTIAGAGLDVYAKEPAVTEALVTMDNVVMLPHLGSATRETRVAMGMRVVNNLKAFFAGEKPPDQVN